MYVILSSNMSIGWLRDLVEFIFCGKDLSSALYCGPQLRFYTFRYWCNLTFLRERLWTPLANLVTSTVRAGRSVVRLATYLLKFGVATNLCSTPFTTVCKAALLKAVVTDLLTTVRTTTITLVSDLILTAVLHGQRAAQWLPPLEPGKL